MAQVTWWGIAWRNLGRNSRRTVLTAAALALGYFAVVVLSGLMQGLVDQLVQNGTSGLTGQLQLHAAGYLPRRSVYRTIGGDSGVDVRALLLGLTADRDIRAAAPRLYGAGLVSAGPATQPAILMGIDPEREAHVTRVLAAIVRGRPPQAGRNEVLIGADMARRLRITVGHDVVVVAPAADGSLGNDRFVVSGVFETGVVELDGAYSLLPLASLANLLAIPRGSVHEIAVAVADPWEAPAVARRVSERIGAGSAIEVRPWTSFRPEILDYARLTDATSWFVLVVVFAVAVFGVANTMLMATFERRHEFALLAALGVRATDIVRLVVYEAVVLAAISLVVGAVVAFPVMVWWHTAPPSLGWLHGGFSLAGALVRPELRVQYVPGMAASSAVALFVTALLGATYPAARASRVPPAGALAEQ